MKSIEIRRHSIRNKPGQNLSQQGVKLARLVGEEMGNFERVITSPVPRAFQTAIAMGYAVDETAELLAQMNDAIELECPWPASFQQYALAIRRNGAAHQFALALADFYNSLVRSIPEGGSALVINHGGIVEISTAACLPEHDLTYLGDYVECCEGVRISWENGNFIRAEIARV